MAKILYGVHGTGHGHAMRALTVARHFPQHEFLFLSHGAGAALLRREYPVMECPNPETPVRGHRVAVWGTLYSNLRVRLLSRGILRQVLGLMDRFQPEVTLSDYEYFLPQASRRVGVRCLSLDHQHVITCASHPIPWRQWPSYWATALAVRRHFSRASHYLVTSFFQPPLKACARTRVLPSLLRESVLKRRPRPGAHVVAYQGYATFQKFVPFLQTIDRPVKVYGLGARDRQGNLQFRKPSEDDFLDDLASCAYVICGGGHTLISEALFYGKPVISFPVQYAFEQFLNAFYVDRLGYGRYSTSLRPGPGLIPSFEARLAQFQQNLQGGRFCGNAEIFAAVEEFIRTRRLDPEGPP
jgi:uncharacterized protein (TIGR00661 family)